ncbi:MAG: hypothetical protein QCH99_06370 [Candidatus Bathyarchaeota archaeon]|nr:hypothetical protein [Candidatus Bathyarchaeum tardum]WGM89810.1 MAG: hypothetical protein NUK63_01415 [Candidatus Bathyarchaeum tardum]
MKLNSEWDRFRTGSLIGVIVSGILLLFSLTRLLGALRDRAWFEGIFMLAVVAALVYTVSALLAQHKFFRKWERRIGLLRHIEEKILNEELKDDKQ